MDAPMRSARAWSVVVAMVAGACTSASLPDARDSGTPADVHSGPIDAASADAMPTDSETADSGVHPDAIPADTGPTDSGIHPDAEAADTGPTDSGIHPDAEAADTGTHPDAEPADTGPTDAGIAISEDFGVLPDATPVDTGPTDSGIHPDAEPVDTGPTDSGIHPDAIPVDTGVIDTGPADTGVHPDAALPDAACSIDAGNVCPRWSKLNIPNTGMSFAPRYEHRAVFDPQSGRITVFGGSDGNVTNQPGTWALDDVLGANPTWLRDPDGPGRYAHTAVYDRSADRMIVWGGASGGAIGQPYALQNTRLPPGSQSWGAITAGGAAMPDPRLDHLAAYDETSKIMMIFGGYNGGSTYFNDLWVLENATTAPAWRPLSTTSAPTRSHAMGAYDPLRNRLIVFGGTTGSMNTNEVWVLSNANGIGGPRAWAQSAILPGPSPMRRVSGVAGYDPAANRLVVWGGLDGATGNILQDTVVWVLTNANGLDCTGAPAASEWLPLTTCGAPGDIPPGREGAAAVYIPSAGKLVVIGGRAQAPPAAPALDNNVFVLDDAVGL